MTKNSLRYLRHYGLLWFMSETGETVATYAVKQEVRVYKKTKKVGFSRRRVSCNCNPKILRKKFNPINSTKNHFEISGRYLCAPINFASQKKKYGKLSSARNRWRRGGGIILTNSKL